MNLSQPHIPVKKLKFAMFFSFLLKFIWFTLNDLAQASPNFFVRGPNKVTQSMSRTKTFRSFVPHKTRRNSIH